MDNNRLLRRYLIALDQLLTGNSEKECSRMSNQVEDLEKYLSGSEYYLSDGGYSRVYLSILEELVYVTSNSLDKVKTNWESSAVQNLIKGLMIFIRQIQDEYYNENTWISRLSIYDSDTNEGSWEMSGVISRVDR